MPLYFDPEFGMEQRAHIDPFTGSLIAAGVGGGVSSLIGGLFGSKAASAQEEAAEDAAKLQWKMYEQARQDLHPYREAADYALYGKYGPPPEPPGWGERGPGPPTEKDLENWRRDVLDPYWAGRPKGKEGGIIGMLEAGPGEFEEDPGYQFRLQEGVKALERGAAARGRQLSGAQGKALTRFGQDYASGEYQNFLNRWYRSMDPGFQLARLGAGPGQTAAQQSIGVGETMGGLRMAGGQAQAAGYLTTGQLGANLMGNVTQNYLAQRLLQPAQTTNQNQLAQQFMGGQQPGQTYYPMPFAIS